jgi:alanine or glycine:cation symporter, AGCS family
MNLISLLTLANNFLAIPTSFLLFGIALYLTIKLKCIQFRSFGRFLRLLTQGIKGQQDLNMKTITPFQALFTALSTSLGIGTIVGPSVAIIMGGPGALFWLVLYAICASVIKFAEVTFALHFRSETKDGFILGGPMRYLSAITPLLGIWYAAATVILFAGWSGVQSNVLAETLARESIPEWITGALLACIVFIMLRGGAQRIGEFNSKLVPFMATLYVLFGIIILFFYRMAIISTISLILDDALTPAAHLSGLLVGPLFPTFRAGIYKGAYITESGIGTAAIPHSMADVERPTNQGVLAMVSVFVDTALCLLSGLLVLVTGVWHTPHINNTLIYDVYQLTFPMIGRPILILTIVLFALGTIIGNSFNGRQNFAAITRYRWLNYYHLFVCAIIFLGAVSHVPFVWMAIELILPLVAIPNVLGIAYLSTRYKAILQD